ncbi:hypothetical protein [Anaeroselena agilis]|uniref:Uncharacterized protein n=1 Tax=Anaeroselena agilis TaxID=3063788 RepID=A0ABU3NZJ7_9FIRM|nr:hypothetical protein [Selenomonadales bacterium 4137-cl]
MENLDVHVGSVEGKGNELIIREGQAAPIYVHKAFEYQAYSTDSLIRLIKSKASKEDCIIAYSDSGVQVILNDTVHDRDQDRLNYAFKHSQQYQEWEPLLKGGQLDQRQFIKFLQRREPDELLEIEPLMAALQNFKFVTNITGDFTFDDRNNYTFSMRVGEAEGTVRIPQMILVNMEIFNESGNIVPVEVEIEVVKPRSESEKVLFQLSCPKLPRYKQEAVAAEIAKIHAELDGYLIVTGKI